MTGPDLTVRERTPQQGKTRPTYRAEIALALGPLTMGEPLDGSYPALHAVPWMLRWDKGDVLRLYQQQGGAWVEVQPGQAFPVLPDTARHISLAFDQAARHVIAWEDAGQVSVRQWDPAAQAYTYRGPFPGADPLLLFDLGVQYEVSSSDVLLLHLSPDRTRAVYRIQRENYDLENELVAGLPGDTVLDQVVAHPYHWQVLGESGGVLFTLTSGTYDPTVYGALTASAGPLQAGELVREVYEFDVQQTLTGTAGPPISGDYPMVDNVIRVDVDAAGFATLQAVAGPLQAGDYVDTVLTLSPPTMATTGSAGPIQSGALVRVVITHDATDVLTAAAGPIQGGAYV